MPVYRRSATEVGLQRRKDAKAKVIVQFIRSKPVHKCSYKPDHRGWLGPVKTTPSKWAKARGAVIAFGLKAGNYRPTIDVASLVKATNRRHIACSGQTGIRHTADTMTSHGDVVPVENPQVLLREPPRIKKPFRSTEDSGEGAVWKTPAPCRHLEDRSKVFLFDRPIPTEPEKLVSAVGSHQAEYMKKVLAEKEREFQLLQRQLIRCNDDNVKLIQELDGFKGKNYADMSRENTILRANNSRLLKENVVLRGNVRKDGNTVLQNLSRKEILDAKYAHRVQSVKPILH
ncbi:uncharacterized protein LOC110450316 [Mizuhopecten yessoensis]|uniref:Uncharacterized protein n=1 Tax=Mizuhopecten yessoensis TaxID=6573 RepID=A0A210QP40_MIZYE|nr:uncharacterized protein LOC110450316 [Mizuhopecten yessoensis]OWF50507.1 hypothetical protein KP79_PYT24578 [Mizuhopecten yessoensis]